MLPSPHFHKPFLYLFEENSYVSFLQKKKKRERKEFVQRTIGGREIDQFFFLSFFFTSESYDIEQSFAVVISDSNRFQSHCIVKLRRRRRRRRQLVRANLLVVVCATSNCMHDIRLLSANWKFLTTSVPLHKAQQRHGTFHVRGPDWLRANLTSMRVI